ncbi:MAG: hypothetical protein ABI844_09430 [Saprospiraceae bacterium]
MDKKKVLQKLIKYQDNLVVDLQRSVADYKTAADIDEGATIDPEDFSFQSNAIDMMNHYKALLVQALYNREKLDSFTEIPSKRVLPGALVETESMIFFIGIPTPPLPYDAGRMIFGISGETKIAQMMRNKKVGQSFNYGKSRLTIKNIL